MSYKIITDSCVDITQQLADQLELEVLPLSVKVGENEYCNYLDYKDISADEFYKLIREGATSATTQVIPSAFEEKFEKYLQQGNDVLYIGFSSGLSGTFNSSLIAKDELSTKYSDRKIICVDSLSASMGQGLLVYYAATMKQQGKSIDEVANWVEQNKLKFAHWFTVDDLDFLKRGGRVSSVAAFFGGMLNIKPILHVDNEGKLIPMEKVRGRKQSLDALVNHMKQDIDLQQNQTIFISHGDALKDAEYVKQRVIDETGITDVKINFVGPVIGSHSGPGTMALFYIAKQR